jgi:hypothetical protein
MPYFEKQNMEKSGQVIDMLEPPTDPLRARSLRGSIPPPLVFDSPSTFSAGSSSLDNDFESSFNQESEKYNDNWNSSRESNKEKESKSWWKPW